MTGAQKIRWSSWERLQLVHHVAFNLEQASVLDMWLEGVRPSHSQLRRSLSVAQKILSPERRRSHKSIMTSNSHWIRETYRRLKNMSPTTRAEFCKTTDTAPVEASVSDQDSVQGPSEKDYHDMMKLALTTSEVIKELWEKQEASERRIEKLRSEYEEKVSHIDNRLSQIFHDLNKIREDVLAMRDSHYVSPYMAVDAKPEEPKLQLVPVTSQNYTRPDRLTIAIYGLIPPQVSMIKSEYPSVDFYFISHDHDNFSVPPSCDCVLAMASFASHSHMSKLPRHKTFIVRGGMTSLRQQIDKVRANALSRAQEG